MSYNIIFLKLEFLPNAHISSFTVFLAFTSMCTVLCIVGHAHQCFCLPDWSGCKWAQCLLCYMYTLHLMLTYNACKYSQRLFLI